MTRAKTKTERMHEERLFEAVTRLRAEDYIDLQVREIAPDAWHTIGFDIDVEEPKEKVTLYLDKSVVKLFKAMGKGYHRRINRILATYVHMQIGGYLNLEEKLLKRM